MKKIALFALLGMALTAMPSAAQINVYGGGGPAFPVSDDIKDDVDAGVNLFGGVTFDATSRFSLYAEGSWGRHSLSDVDANVTPTSLMAGGIFGFTDNEDAAVSPYIFGGLGVQTVKVGNDVADISDSTFGYQFGAGLGFGLGGLDAFAEGRYQAASYGEDSDFGDFSFAVVTAAIGLSIALGGG